MGRIDPLAPMHPLRLHCDGRQSQPLAGISGLQQCLDQSEATQHTVLLCLDQLLRLQRLLTAGRNPHQVIDARQSVNLFHQRFQAGRPAACIDLQLRIATAQLDALLLIGPYHPHHRTLRWIQNDGRRYHHIPHGRQQHRSLSLLPRHAHLRCQRLLPRGTRTLIRRPAAHPEQPHTHAPVFIAHLHIQLLDPGRAAGAVAYPRPLRLPTPDDLHLIDRIQQPGPAAGFAGPATARHQPHTPLQRAVQQARMQYVLRLRPLQLRRQLQLRQDLFRPHVHLLQAAKSLPVFDPHLLKGPVALLRIQHGHRALPLQLLQIQQRRGLRANPLRHPLTVDPLLTLTLTLTLTRSDGVDLKPDLPALLQLKTDVHLQSVLNPQRLQPHHIPQTHLPAFLLPTRRGHGRTRHLQIRRSRQHP